MAGKIYDDAVAVVTGGGSGIGRALALGVARRGACVAVADVQMDRCQAVVDEIAEIGGRALALRCDVADAAQVDALADAIRAEFGGLNLAFNNAGVISGGPIEKTSAADAAWMFGVNVLGVFNGMKAFLPLLREAQAAGRIAHIVNTGSENAFGVPVIGPTSVYTATKHAVLGMTDALRRDLEGGGIRVSLLCPGLVSTEIFDARRNRPDQFGGPRHATPEVSRRMQAMMAEQGPDPALTAELCFEGMARGDFLIVTDPKIRSFANKRHREVEAALDLIDTRLA